MSFKNLLSVHKTICPIAIACGLFLASCNNKVALFNPDIITSDADGNVYVMQRYDKIIKFNRDSQVLFEIEKRRTFKKDYSYPWLFDVGPDGAVYVVYVTLDYRTGKTASEYIARYSPQGTFEKVVFQVVHTREEMEVRTQYYTIQGMAMAGRNIRAVLSQSDGTIELATIDPAGTVLARWPIDIYSMSGMCVDRTGTTVLTDVARNEVLLVNDSGNVTRRFGATGTAPAEFRCPVAVCVDDRGNIYVCDEGNRRIQQFDPSGGLIRIFAKPDPAPGAGDVDLRSATAVNGGLYAAEALGNRIVVFDPQGRIVREITNLGRAWHQELARNVLAGLGLLAGLAGLFALLWLTVKVYRRKIGVRLIVLFAGAGVAVVCAASLLIYSVSRRNWEKEVREKYLTIAQMLAAEIPYEKVAAVRAVEDDRYKELLEKFRVVLKKSSNIDWIGIYLVEGDRLYWGIDTEESGLYTPLFKVSRRHREVLHSGVPGYFEYADETGQYLAAVAPIVDSSGAVRTILEVSCDLDFLKKYRRTILYNVAGVSAACILVFCLISILLSLTITRPIKGLTRGAQAVEEGRFDFRLPEKHQHEVGRFIQTFNAMMHSLAEKEKIRSIMNKVVSKEVASELLKSKLEMGGTERRVSILFSDIRGFTAIAESMAPADLVSLLNDFFSRMSPVIDREGGVIDKYIGDAIMAIFGAPLEFPDDAVRAVRAGAGMIRELKDFNEARQNMNLPPVRIGVGINSGTVVAGNIGSENRLNYTIIGDAVNLASRLEGLTKYYGVEMIVSEEVAARVRDRYVLRELDLVRVKGKKEGGRIVEVIVSNEGQWTDLVRIFSQAVEHYRAQKWDEAEAGFNRVLARMPADKPSSLYVARISKYRQQPPPPEWDGVYTAKEK